MLNTAGEPAPPALPVLTAVVSSSLESALVAGFTQNDLGVTVVRRCVDIVELLAAAASGVARAALVSADFRGLDAEALAQLGTSGLATVGLAGDERHERFLYQLGFGLVVPADASPEQVAGALLAAGVTHTADASAAAPRTLPRRAPDAHDDVDGQRVGSLIAVWGPTGAPGRTTVALGLAEVLAQRGQRASSSLLIDADPYGGAVATLTGLLDESPGIAAACRAANAGALDVARLAECCAQLPSGMRILTGLTQASRWPELRPAALEMVLTCARRLAPVTVIDTGFCLESDEELSYDTLAPQRNAATLTAIGAADRIVAVASADPLGLSRLTRELPRLAALLGEPLSELTASGRVLVAVNRVRSGLLPGDPGRAAVEALERHAGVTPVALLTNDPVATDAAHGIGRLLGEAAPDSALLQGLVELAKQIVPAGDAAAGASKAARRGRYRQRRRLTPASR